MLNFYQASNLSLIQNESYQQSPEEKWEWYQQSHEKMKNNGKHKKKY